MNKVTQRDIIEGPSTVGTKYSCKISKGKPADIIQDSYICGRVLKGKGYKNIFQLRS